MKTQQEIEKMKDEIGIKISDTSSRMNKLSDLRELQKLSDIKRQRIAQYNILPKVLK